MRYNSGTNYGTTRSQPLVATPTPDGEMHKDAAFGRLLKERRTSLDLTQEELAALAGCSTETVRKLEAGGRRPSKAIAQGLADGLQLLGTEREHFLHLARTPATSITRQTVGRGVPPIADQPAEGPTDPVAVVNEPAQLLATKVYLPRPRARLVVRARLLERLDADAHGLLTLVAAPAGSGKTTILTNWLHRRLATKRNAAWLALDPSDSDPIQFLRYLIAALQTIDPTVGTAVLPFLRSAQALPLEPVMRVLVNDAVRLPEGSVLVLDDYHVIDAPPVHQALAFLIDHLPPQLHLVIASRVDPPLPLARWRVRGQLTEVRANDLRFTTEEVLVFFRDVMEVPLSFTDAAAVEAHTEGWIAGLQLAALSLQERPAEQMSSFIDAFTGNHRFVVDYLVDEVLARQPAYMQRFLLQTSILERLCGPLCDAVMLGTANPDSSNHLVQEQAYSQTLLEELERNNLFIIPLDQTRHWYRYHHLFAQVLQERLMSGTRPATIAALHRNASVWFQQQGQIAEAVQHILAAQDWIHAAGLIEAHGLSLIQRGQVQTVLAWLSRLPENLLPARPYLLLLHAIGLFFVSRLELAEQRAQAVEDALVVVPQDEWARNILGAAISLRGSMTRFRGDLMACNALLFRALELLPPTEVASRAATRVSIVATSVVQGEVTQANEHLLRTNIAIARDAGDLNSLINGLITLADLQRQRGQLRLAAITYGQAAQVAPEPLGLQALINSAAYYFGMGDLLREQNDLDSAERYLRQGQELIRAKLLATADTNVFGYIALARLLQARGAHDAAIATLREIEALIRERRYAPRLLRRISAARAELALRQTDLEAAVEWTVASGLRASDSLTYLSELEYLTLVRVQIAQAGSDRPGQYLGETFELLDRLQRVAEDVGRIDSVIVILVLRGLALHVQGNLPGAFAALEQALVLAGPEDYVRVFVDEGAPMAALLMEFGKAQVGLRPAVRAYVERLLTGMGATIPIPHPTICDESAAHSSVPPLPAHIEPLTEREREVLRLLAAGMSNQAIAQELVVAVGTVKRHVNSILGKLAAESRLQAVARARELNLI